MFPATSVLQINHVKTCSESDTFYDGLYRGNLADTDLSSGRLIFPQNSSNTVTLSQGWSAEVVGVYRLKEVYGFLDVSPVWFLSGGVQKQLWGKKANIKLNVTDLFYTNKIRGAMVLTGYSENFYQRRESRVVTLSFTYRFGHAQVAPSRRRTGGAEEEKLVSINRSSRWDCSVTCKIL